MRTKISDVLPAPVTVDTGNGVFEVNGIGTQDLVRLIKKHKTEFAQLLVLNPDGEPDYTSILEKAPELVSDVICAGAGCAGDEEQENAAKQLPAGVQLTAIGEIWRLTVPDAKKLRTLLLEMFKTVKEVSPVKVKGVLDRASQNSPPESKP